jgi:hypothetical protein
VSTHCRRASMFAACYAQHENCARMHAFTMNNTHSPTNAGWPHHLAFIHARSHRVTQGRHTSPPCEQQRTYLEIHILRVDLRAQGRQHRQRKHDVCKLSYGRPQPPHFATCCKTQSSSQCSKVRSPLTSSEGAKPQIPFDAWYVLFLMPHDGT